MLIVEDEAMIAWNLESLLEDYGFETIMIAADAEQAIAMATASAPQLIISDVNLGGGPDGIDTVERLLPTCGASVVFVSAYADEKTRRRIEDLTGSAVLLPKPVASDELRGAIDRMLRGSRPNRRPG